MFCINFCEIFNFSLMHSDMIEKFCDYVAFKQKRCIERINIGSSFCSQYFCRFSGYKKVLEICAKRGIHVTLTIPVFSEKDIETGKKKAEQICKIAGDIIDEITVNDMGMLDFFKSKIKYKINLGRLFFKDPRDCRMPQYLNEPVSPMLLSHLKDEYWSLFRFNLVELDPTNNVIDTTVIKDTDISVGIHKPYCYMTTGNICKFASIHRDIKEKFRPNSMCKIECEHIMDTYSGHVVQTDCDPVIRRFGRTLYYEINSVKLIGKNAEREIFFPVNEWREFKFENIGTFE